MELLLTIVFICFPLSIVLGFVGRSRRIGFWGAFWVSFLFSPIVGFLAVLLSKRKKTENPLDDLKKLSELKAAGVLSEEEYQAKVRKYKAMLTVLLVAACFGFAFSCKKKTDSNSDPSPTSTYVGPKLKGRFRIQESDTSKQAGLWIVTSDSLTMAPYDPVNYPAVTVKFKIVWATDSLSYYNTGYTSTTYLTGYTADSIFITSIEKGDEGDSAHYAYQRLMILK